MIYDFQPPPPPNPLTKSKYFESFAKKMSRLHFAFYPLLPWRFSAVADSPLRQMLALIVIQTQPNS